MQGRNFTSLDDVFNTLYIIYIKCSPPLIIFLFSLFVFRTSDNVTIFASISIMHKIAEEYCIVFTFIFAYDILSSFLLQYSFSCFFLPCSEKFLKPAFKGIRLC